MRKYEINKCNKNNQGTEERNVVFYTEWLGKEAECDLWAEIQRKTGRNMLLSGRGKPGWAPLRWKYDVPGIARRLFGMIW